MSCQEVELLGQMKAFLSLVVFQFDFDIITNSFWTII